MLTDHFFTVLQPYLTQPRKFVLAFSGGVDSRVMLQLLAQFQAKHKNAECIAVHVHHGLSEHADTWQQQCESWTNEVGIPLYVEKVTLSLGARVSIEQAAREARYQALEKYISRDDVLLTGQHSDDQVETFLLALKRGSGPAGLSAMASMSQFGQGVMVRPLLSVPRHDVEAFAKSEQLEWVEDESNQDTQFDRNFLRHQVTPQLNQRWPGFRKSVMRTAELCAEQESLLTELLMEKLQFIKQPDGSVDIPLLHQESDSARAYLLRMWLASHQCQMPSRIQLEQMWQDVACASTDANPIFSLHDMHMRRFQQRLYLVRPCEDITDWRAPLVDELALPDGLGRLALKALSGRELVEFGLRLPSKDEVVTVCFNPEGISAHPQNRGHSRKLKKLFQEYGIPSWNRRRTPLIFYGEQLAAVAGLFVCRGFVGQQCELTWHI